MAYPNIPPNLQDMFGSLDNRIRKLETIGPGNVFIEPFFLMGIFTGTKNIDLNERLFFYFQANSTSNGTLNFRGSYGLSLFDMMQEQQSITCAVVIKNGTNGYYPTAFTVDGNFFSSILWVDGVPIAGTPNAEDSYIFTIMKIQNSPVTWYCRASRVTYA